MTRHSPGRDVPISPAHEGFTIERRLPAPPSLVWRAWADPALKSRWVACHNPPAFTVERYTLDFRIGGTETGDVRLGNGPMSGRHSNRTVYLDIEEAVRIVFAYSMSFEGRLHSASLATVLFQAEPGGTLVRYTEQGVYLDGSDGATMRQGGWTDLLAALETSLAA